MANLITRKEAAKRLGISLATLDLARSSGQITYIQYSEYGRVFFTEEALNEYIEKSTHSAREIKVPYTYRKRRK